LDEDDEMLAQSGYARTENSSLPDRDGRCPDGTRKNCRPIADGGRESAFGVGEGDCGMRTSPVRRVLRFDAFTLDLARCLLLRGDADLRLRPQAFDMLRYLAAHPGRLVSKSELMEAIWPGVTVGDDSLVRCVRDIREALGDREHRIVKTLPKRGYMFAVDVSEADIATDPELPPAATHLPQLGLDHWQALLSRVIAGRLEQCCSVSALWSR
jgi:DNA-binding winged helix-turn-helix (wHTH) protein